MRRPRYLDMRCPTCDVVHERFVETNDDDTPLAPEICNHEGCGAALSSIDTVFSGYMKTITEGNHDFNERERERLEKRGDEHWRKHGCDEAIERERAMLKKNGMDGAGGVR